MRQGGDACAVIMCMTRRVDIAWWNIPALCQRCHLQIQAKVVMERFRMFEHTEWFKPYVAGYYVNMRELPSDKEYVLERLEELLI